MYKLLPVAFQNALVSLEGWRIQRWRYSAAFWKLLAEAEARSALSQEEFCAKRDAQLQLFVEHAASSVPYYRALFKKLGAFPEDFRSVEDLQQLPILTKQQVQADPAAFLSSAVPRRELVEVHTSGTTGAGLRFNTTISAQIKQWAIWWRYFRVHDLNPGTWCANFGGRLVVPAAQAEPPFWRTNTPGKQTLFSAYHQSPRGMTFYLQELRKRRHPWIHGYPSQIALLAAHMDDTNFDLGYSPRWITTGAENLLPHQSAQIARAFGKAPIQHYGMTEAAANFSECRHGALHVDEDFSAVEFVNDNAGRCRIIGTNFSNLASPLIRYEIGDTCELATNPCSCGRPGRVVANVDGRLEDVVVLGNGARVGRLDHVFKDLLNVQEAQIRQSRAGEIQVLIVRRPAFNLRDDARIRREFADRLGSQTRVTLCYVDRLERSSTGKLRFVVNSVPLSSSAQSSSDAHS